MGTANKRMNRALFQLVALIWEEEINGLLETSTTANFSPGALPRVSTAPCCTDRACCVLVPGGGRGIGRSEKQDGSPALLGQSHGCRQGHSRPKKRCYTRYEPQVKAGTSTWAQVAKRFAQRGPGRVELKIWRITEVERYLFLY